MPWPPPTPGTWVIDLDGVVWRAGRPIAGVPEAIKTLREAGNRLLFVTNNATPTIGDLIATLRRAGIPVTPDDVLGSAQAAAGMLRPGDRVLVIGEAGLRQALTSRGARLVDEPPVDAVMVSRASRFDYAVLARAAALVRGGARLVGTNEDPTYPTPEGLVPGTGALLAAVAAAAGAAPEVAGKPHGPMVDLVRERAGEVSVVVGDRPSTDGRLADRLGARYALVLSGVTASGAGADPPPDIVSSDLAALVATLDRASAARTARASRTR